MINNQLYLLENAFTFQLRCAPSITDDDNIATEGNWRLAELHDHLVIWLTVYITKIRLSTINIRPKSRPTL